MCCRIMQKTMKIFVVAVFVRLGITSAQFLEQFDPGTVFTPVQNQVTLSCSVEERYIIDWRVSFTSGEVVNAANVIASGLLIQRNFTLDGVATTRSTLSLWETGSQTNNGSNITCLAQEIGAGITSPIPGHTVKVIFYGIPPLPSGLSVAENGIGFLNISWSLEFIDGVEVNYTLTVVNLNATSGQPLIIAGLPDQHYTFDISSPCDVYSFTVIAVTAAGNSTNSQELIFTGDRSMCSATTTLEDASQTMSSDEVITISTILNQDTSTTISTYTQPTTMSTPDNSNVTLTIAVSVVVAIVISILVLVNAMVCACCHRRNKKTTKTEVTVTDPVYETPGDVLPPPLPQKIDAPFIMTLSSAYDAVDPQKVSGKYPESAAKLSFNDYPLKSPDIKDSAMEFAMASPSANNASEKIHLQPMDNS